MNPFYEPFPKTVRVGGEDFPIRTDFRAVLKMMESLETGGSPMEKLEAILGLYKEAPRDIKAAVSAATRFVAGAGENEQKNKKEKEKKTISYKKDAPYIIGDFLRFYGIDLTSCRYLHWQKFQMLLLGLSEDSEIKKRIAYRCVDTGKIKDRRERARIIRIQKALSIEDTEADAERIGEMFGGLV